MNIVGLIFFGACVIAILIDFLLVLFVLWVEIEDYIQEVLIYFNSKIQHSSIVLRQLEEKKEF
jgi:hypothetical protein